MQKQHRESQNKETGEYIPSKKEKEKNLRGKILISETEISTSDKQFKVIVIR